MLMEKGVKYFVWAAILLQIGFFSETLVQAQDQSGFISIDCGLPANSTYADSVTGINYISDESFIDPGNGISNEISIASRDGYDQALWHLRSFPKGVRNCYTIDVKKGQKYLIRARFLYANYDNKNATPEFDLYLGVSYWDTISPGSLRSYRNNKYWEMIHVVSTNKLQICLVNKGNGAPFISAIELRPMPMDIYNEAFGDNESLFTLERYDMGNVDYQPPITRYGKGDMYNRLWEPYESSFGIVTVRTLLPVDNALTGNYFPPSTVMMTATVAEDSLSLPISMFVDNLYTNHSILPLKMYFYLYFAELEQLQPNQSRFFSIYSDLLAISAPPMTLLSTHVTPTYLSNTMKILSGKTLTQDSDGTETQTIELIIDEGSTLEPLINAFEAYAVMNMPDSQTEERDVDAMMNIKSVYGVTKRNWQGDPCSPEAFKWDGVNCSFDASNTSSIISLNLSSWELTGNISSYISNLRSLKVLDLSYNNLSGPVPDFLADMSFLKVVNLSGNNLTGSVPEKLLQKSKSGSLSLSLERNPHLCQKEEVCNNTDQKSGAPNKENNTQQKKGSALKVGIAVASLLIICFVAMAIFWHLRYRRNLKLGPVPANTSLRRISYSEIATVTENFKTVIGEGGFGKVYLGKLGDTKVAVKMLSPSSVQGCKEFQAEAELLMRVHHKNLVSLVGYCNEGNNLGLIYEYMALGNLRKNLTETENILTWEQRLQIARDAAHGLDHLHRGPTLPMIHRNVKSSNILITEQFIGKVTDFGLSRTYPLTGGSHETAAIAGTHGYLDPEYFATNSLNEKSDVYSFGIVLMEIVTCQSVIGCSPEDHIIPYVTRMVSTGDISRIIDPRLQGKADVNCVRRVLELAEDCVAQESSGRPNMKQVAMELDECLASMIIRSP